MRKSGETFGRLRSLRSLLKRRYCVTIVRFFVTSILLAYIFWKVNLREVVGIFQHASLPYSLAALALAIFSNLLYSQSWKMVLAAQDISVSLPRLATSYHIGLFFNNFLPSMLGGDISRLFELSQYTKRRIESFVSILVTRFISLYCMLLIGLVTAIAMGWPGAAANPDVVLITCLGVVAMTCLAYLATRITFADRVPLLGHLGHLIAATRPPDAPRVAFLDNEATLLQALAFSLLSQVVGLGAVYLMSRALGFSVPWYYFLLFMPVIRLAVILPISINGFGVSEGAFATLFTRAGLSVPEAVSLSLLGQFLMIAVSLAGGVLFLIEHKLERVRQVMGYE